MGIVYVLPKITKQKHVKQLKDMNVVLYVKMNVKKHVSEDALKNL